ncbi:hypothetical protein DF3PB_1770007 [uncultured Defluviicoccus sp.]|uniref:Uncharacterized protein n=1 Tax=metagenome TaxID=256318 RepID=A0A380TAA8_9ZZZZ|nr:hypothetical protein DF3PB_1770007 [uncultured Defluviicoccus sp.]
MSDFKGRHFEGEIVLWAVRRQRPRQSGSTKAGSRPSQRRLVPPATYSV